MEIQVDAKFGAPGEPAHELSYRVKVDSDAPAEAIRELIHHTDRVAEVHNTLRAGVGVQLVL